MDRLKKIFQKFYVVSRKSREWRAFVFCLAAIVVFTTTYSMILPAITVEKNATEDVGGLVVEETAPGSTGGAKFGRKKLSRKKLLSRMKK